MSSSLIILEQLWKIYPVGPGVPALRGIDLRMGEGEYVAIMGPSGSGKSTVLNVLGCLDRPTSGRYHLGGQDVSDMDDDALSEVRSLKIGFVFQSFNLISQITVLANIEVPLFYQGMPRRQRRRRSMELAEAVGLADRASHRPQELSGGQQQRVAIARSLANDPLMLLADEPTGNLDSTTSREILDLFDELNARGRTIVIVTHDEDIAKRSCRIVQLKDGLVSSDSQQEASVS